MAMTSCVLLLSLLVPTVAQFTRVDQWHVQKFSAAGCSAQDKVEDDYKELEVCRQEDSSTWKKAAATNTLWTETKYTDSTCSTVKTSETPQTLNAACTAKDGQWQTGSVVSTLDTYRGSDYSDNECTTLAPGEWGPGYHAVNTCEQTGASTSIFYRCTAANIQPEIYATNDCSGTADTSCSDCGPFVSGDVCTAYPNGHENAGKFYKKNCGSITGGSASGGGRLCSHGLTQLILAATAAVAAAVMSF